MPPTPTSRAKYLAKVLRRRQQWVQEHGPCKRCGSSQDLQVHHRDSREKVSHRIWTWRAERRAAELVKCEAICRACHIAIHALLNRKPHGMGGYRRGCRCDICRAAIAPQIEAQRLKRIDEDGPQPPRTPGERRATSYRDRYVIVHDDEGESDEPV